MLPSKSGYAILFIVLGMFFISVNDMVIKRFSGEYPLHQMVFLRSAIGMFFTLILIRLEGGWRILKTDQPGLHALRAVMVFFVSAALYCSDDAPEQCFSLAKAVSALTVVCGVICYAHSSPALAAKLAKDSSAKQTSPLLQPSEAVAGHGPRRMNISNV